MLHDDAIQSRIAHAREAEGFSTFYKKARDFLVENNQLNQTDQGPAHHLAHVVTKVN